MPPLHYVHGSPGSPVCPKRSVPWDFDLFFLCVHVWLGPAKFYHGLSRSITVSVAGRGVGSPGVSKAPYGSARGLPRPTLPHVSHVLLRFITFC